jgi:hypothetical protein
LALASKLGHYILYALLLAVPCLGIIAQLKRGNPLPIFGAWDVASPWPADRAMARSLREVHGLVANALLIFAGVHAVAAWRTITSFATARSCACCPGPAGVGRVDFCDCRQVEIIFLRLRQRAAAIESCISRGETHHVRFLLLTAFAIASAVGAHAETTIVVNPKDRPVMPMIPAPSRFGCQSASTCSFRSLTAPINQPRRKRMPGARFTI